MCKCIREIEEKTKNELSNKNEEYKDRTITKVAIQNTALMLWAKQTLQISSPVKIEYDVLNKKGDLVHKKETVNFSYKYCPFCGEKYE